MKFIVAGGLNMFANWKQVQTVAIEADQLGYWGFVLPDHYMWEPIEVEILPSKLGPP